MKFSGDRKTAPYPGTVDTTFGVFKQVRLTEEECNKLERLLAGIDKELGDVVIPACVAAGRPPEEISLILSSRIAFVAIAKKIAW